MTEDELNAVAAAMMVSRDVDYVGIGEAIWEPGMDPDELDGYRDQIVRLIETAEVTITWRG